MKIEIIAIGNELLKGSVMNSNAAFISQNLRQNGYLVKKHLVISDEHAEIEKTLKEAASTADVVITTGGLGPTIDDITKDVIRNFSDVKEIPNRVGKAPGLIAREKNCSIISLPGVKKEMEAMFLSDVLPYLFEKHPLKAPFFMEIMHICQKLEMDVDQTLREIQKLNPDVELGIYPSLGLVHVTFSVHAENELEAREKIRPIKEALTKKYETYLYESNSGKIEEALHFLLLKQKKTLSLAESCTGGDLASKLTRLPESSQYFLGSVVSYSNAAKEKLLQVDPSTLENKGAVSEETVREMVEGVTKITGSNLGVGISGIAGPGGGTEEKPVGTVLIAFSFDGQIITGKKHFEGGRNYVIEETANFVFSSLYRYLMYQKNLEFS